VVASAGASGIRPIMTIVHALGFGASASGCLLRIGAGVDIMLFIDIVSIFLIRCTVGMELTSEPPLDRIEVIFDTRLTHFRNGENFRPCGQADRSLAMKIGMCAPIDKAMSVAAMGFDYLEPIVFPIAALDEGAFSALVKQVRSLPIRCAAFNTLFPKDMKIVGPQADAKRTATYIEKAVSRVAALGAEILVVGSGPSRTVPSGWDMSRGIDQFAETLVCVGNEAAKHGITAVIEPLNTRESNIVNSVAEGQRLVIRVGHPSVKLLADFYHMRLESEDMGNIRRAGTVLRHAHIANSDGRRYPRERSEDRYDEFFAALVAIGYQGMLSAEPMSGDLASEAPGSLALFRKLAADHGM
jgi:D-psicose/D-tagatose/L-ribulose 3-epimerase